MKTSAKQVFESDNWIITKISQGNRNNVRIDAKRRYQVADMPSFFSEWISRPYAERLSAMKYNRQINELSCYSY